MWKREREREKTPHSYTQKNTLQLPHTILNGSAAYQNLNRCGQNEMNIGNKLNGEAKQQHHTNIL